MTSPPDCKDCFHHVLDETRGAVHSRCTRHHKLKIGRLDMMANGWLCVFERDQIPEPQRIDGDKCSPEGIHFVRRTP